MIKKMLLPALVLSLSFSQAAFSHESHQTGCPYDHCVRAAVKSVHLTKDQQTKVDAMKAEMKASLHGKWSEMKELHAQAKVLIRSEKMDEAKLDTLINQKKELMGSIMKTKIMMKHHMYNVLDAKQKASLSTKMDQCEKEKMDAMKKMMDDSKGE
ncbi:MAG: Spy/CpxP family protein refolding chaperone [Gammaproteobacteria bacterium]|nr:Spy/CpxP family protein refolding chaperone [Gammaproteobacteria bacterium]